MRWHYTVGEGLHEILRDGFITREPLIEIRGELSVVWFASAETWETNSDKGWRASHEISRPPTMQDTELTSGFFRIGVSDNYPLQSLGKGWFGRLEEVPLAECEVIEILTPEGWRPVTQEDLDHLKQFMDQR